MRNVFFKLRLHARGQVPAISVLPGDRYLADATMRSWLLFCANAQYLIPENTEGFCRAAGGEEPPKSEGGGNER